MDQGGNAHANQVGIAIEGNNNQVGGFASNGEGNLISANTTAGVLICYDCVEGGPTRGAINGSNNLVLGNLIGTAPSGTAAMGNGAGVSIFGRGFSTQLNAYFGDVNGNAVGGGGALFSDYANVISGNTGDGVQIENAPGDFVGGNSIGVDAAGTSALANAGNGITVQDAPGTVLGDFPQLTFPCTLLGRPSQCAYDEGGANIISGNSGDGVRVFNTQNTHDVAILGNKIGTDINGSAGIPNVGNGINLTGVAPGKNNRIGVFSGTGGGDANVIAFNQHAGVIVGVDPNLNLVAPLIRFNQIFSNGGLGIDEGSLFNPGAAPIVTSVVSGPSGTTITGHTASSSSSVVVDLYGSASCDPSGMGEGAALITSITVAGNFSLTVPNQLQVGSVVTATASSTSPTGFGTTAFSPCAAVTSTS